MFLKSYKLLWLVVVLTLVNSAFARKSVGYPRSGGLSGHGSSGSHNYPSHRYPTGGLSGSGGSHSYPSSHGLSGTGTGGGSHAYPASNGMSGSGSRYPNSGNSHNYPSSNGLSGNSNSPKHTTINNNYHYNYAPPQQIRYTPVHGGSPVSYPVYHGSPPNYVYQYKDSSSKYGTLLAGLALFNLGALGGVAAAHIGNSGSGSGSSSHYKPHPGEVCKFGIKKDNGDYEETRIDCQLISSFIMRHEAKQNNPMNTSVVTTTVTNVTVVNTTNGVPDAASNTATPNFTMLPNGTLVPMNGTNGEVSNTTVSDDSNHNVTMTSSVTTTTTNTTVTNALDVKGPPVQVTPGMQCYVMRNTPYSRMKETVPCGVFQAYAEKSLRKNSATRNLPILITLSSVLVAFVLY